MNTSPNKVSSPNSSYKKHKQSEFSDISESVERSSKKSSVDSQSNSSSEKLRKSKKSTILKSKTIFEKQSDYNVLFEEDEQQLVKLNMNYEQLNDYINNIIKVVNQHAKLLNTLNQEIQIRVTEKEMGQVLAVIADGLPGNLTNGKSISKGLISRQQSNEEENKKEQDEIEDTFSTKQKQQELAMIEGTERFQKVTEIIGQYLNEFKEYNKKNDKEIERIDVLISERVTQNDYDKYCKNNEERIAKEVKFLSQEIDEQIQNLDGKLQKQSEDTRKHISQVEANTYRKLKDHEVWIEDRPTEHAMKEHVLGEINKSQIHLKDVIHEEKNMLLTRIENCEFEIKSLKNGLFDQIMQLQQGNDNFNQIMEQEREKHQASLEGVKELMQDLFQKFNKMDFEVQDNMNSLDKKMSVLEKQIVDNYKTQKSMLPTDYVSNEKFENMKEKQECLIKDVDKLTKQLTEANDQNTLKLQQFEKDLSKKAEKETLLQNQQQFFETLSQIANETDASITRLIGDELKKLGDQIMSSQKYLEKKIAKVYDDINIDKLKVVIDKKYFKDEAVQKFEGQDNKIKEQDKSIKGMQGQVSRLTVSTFVLLIPMQSLIENLALAIKTLESMNKGQQIGPANLASAISKSALGGARNSDQQNLPYPKFGRSLTKFQNNQLAINGLEAPVLQYNAASLVESNVYDNMDLVGDSPFVRRMANHYMEQDFSQQDYFANENMQSNPRLFERPQSQNSQYQQKKQYNTFRRSEVVTKPQLQQTKHGHKQSVGTVNLNPTDMLNRSSEHYQSVKQVMRPPSNEEIVRFSQENKLSSGGQQQNARVNSNLSRGPLNKLLNLHSSGQGNQVQSQNLLNNKLNIKASLHDSTTIQDSLKQ